MDEKTFDLDAVLKMLDGDLDAFSELANLFIVKAPEDMDKIQKAISSCDSDGLERFSHALKSSAGYFRAEKVYKIAVNLENFGVSGSFAEAHASFEVLKKEMDRLLKDLRSESENVKAAYPGN